MNLERLTQTRATTRNILNPELPEWAEGAKKITLAPARTRSIAQNLIEVVEDHRHLRRAKIVLLMRFGMKAGRDGRIELGKAKKTSPLLTFLGRGADFIIQLNAEEWNQTTRGGALALMDHELSHCGCDVGMQWVPEGAVGGFVAKMGWRHVRTREDIQDSAGQIAVYFTKLSEGRPRFCIRKHDVETFVPVVIRWGAWLPQLGRLAMAFEEFDPEAAGVGRLFSNGKPEPEPEPAAT